MGEADAHSDQEGLEEEETEQNSDSHQAAAKASKQQQHDKHKHEEKKNKPAEEKQQQQQDRPDHMHPSRRPGQSRNNAPHRPGYYDKALAEASKKKAEQEAREAEFRRRREERERKNAERERFQRAMKKARTPGFRDGQRKLGRESGLLLEKARRITQQR